MRQVIEMNIKSQTYYFFNDMINIEEFDSNLIKIDKKIYKDIDIYYTGYINIKKIGDCENIYTVNPLYLIIGEEIDGHIEENNGCKYLVFDSLDENRGVLKIETKNGGKEVKYDKDLWYMKNKPVKLCMLTIIVRSFFEGDETLYSQVYLDKCFFMSYKQ